MASPPAWAFVGAASPHQYKHGSRVHLQDMDGGGVEDPAASFAVLSLPAPEMALIRRAKKESHPPGMPAPQCWFGRFGSGSAQSLAFLGSRRKHLGHRPMIWLARGGSSQHAMTESPWLQRGGSAQLPFPTVCVFHRKIPPTCRQSPAATLRRCFC